VITPVLIEVSADPRKRQVHCDGWLGNAERGWVNRPITIFVVAGRNDRLGAPYHRGPLDVVVQAEECMIFDSRVPAVTAGAAPADAFYLDVRERDEWRAGHIHNARHIPLGELVARIDELPADRQIVCVCRVGGRSAQATVFLNRQGYEVVNLDGGMEAWRGAGHPMVSEDGQPPRVI
jgi:rhodanese-related sulfurtransferase